MIVYGRLEARISRCAANFIFALHVDIYIGSNRSVTISVESRACHFRSGQLDLQLVPDQFAKCLCTLKLALVKFTHFRRELECKSGHLGSQGTILAVVYKLPEDGV